MKRTIIALIFLFTPCLTFADSIVIFSTNTNNCLRFLPSRDPVNYVGRIDAMIFNDTTSQTEEQVQLLISTTPIRYFKKSGTRQIVEMTQAEKDQVEAQERTARINSARVSALRELLGIGSSYARDRAIVLLSKDEVNHIREWLTSFKVEVASATSLNDLKTRVGKLPAMPNRTSEQAKTALQNILSSGQADE